MDWNEGENYWRMFRAKNHTARLHKKQIFLIDERFDDSTRFHDGQAAEAAFKDSGQEGGHEAHAEHNERTVHVV